MVFYFLHKSIYQRSTRRAASYRDEALQRTMTRMQVEKDTFYDDAFQKRCIGRKSGMETQHRHRSTDLTENTRFDDDSSSDAFSSASGDWKGEVEKESPEVPQQQPVKSCSRSSCMRVHTLEESLYPVQKSKPSSRSRTLRVRFQSVEIREYTYDCWKYRVQDPISIDEYELLSLDARNAILFGEDYTIGQMIHTQFEKSRDQACRGKTVSCFKYSRVKEVLEKITAWRKNRRQHVQQGVEQRKNKLEVALFQLL